MDVGLVVVPFADVERPAIGVSLLSAEVQRAGFSCQVYYLNFDLAEMIGKPLYTTVSESLPAESLVGEWFFADQVFGDVIPPADQYVQKILSRFLSGPMLGELLKARALRERFIDESVRRIQAGGARIVGFSTTFHQTCCCLAIARRLKQAADAPLVVFGGANCEGEMGLQMLRSFPWIDHVCTREGDIAFPELVRRLLHGGDPHGIPGMLSQGRSTVLSTPELVENLDELPDPDYSDYFERLSRADPALAVQPELLVETSRGCWWGAKHHCTFCGLNGDTMHFRSKSPERAFAEMKRLAARWPARKMDCVDNILDMRYFDGLFPQLAQQPLGLELFYEVKANLRLEHVQALRAAGVKTIQPGIESLSSEVLALMDKGCTGLQNLQLLRWCQEEGITVAWNLLAGFPGESPAAYAWQAALVPALLHLQPPSSCSPVRLDRFSPLFTRAAQFGLQRVRPTSAYFYVFPLDRGELSRLGSFFDFDHADGRQPDVYLAGLRREVEKWIVLQGGDPAQRPRLDLHLEPGGLRLEDTRPGAATAVLRLQGWRADLLLACDAGQSAARLQERMAGSAAAGDVQAQLDAWVAERLLAHMDGRYLCLAVFRDRPPSFQSRQPHARIPIAAATAARPLPSPA